VVLYKNAFWNRQEYGDDDHYFDREYDKFALYCRPILILGNHRQKEEASPIRFPVV